MQYAAIQPETYCYCGGNQKMNSDEKTTDTDPAVIDIIIPTYKPDKRLLAILEHLEKQTLPVHRIIIMNTEEKYFETLIYGTAFFEKHKKIKVYHLSKREFDHGKTRHIAVQKSEAEIFVMMTQDSIPWDNSLLENLVSELRGNVAVAYARQLPAENCSEMERFSRLFNYPPQSRLKTQQDTGELGIKAYFCSNSCAAYRRDIYEELGGFIRHTIFNEDMIYAAKAMQSGYAIYYAAEAKVIHSHNYTDRQQFHRNFDMAVSQADHPEIFAEISSESEGKRLIRETRAHLKKMGLRKQIPRLYIQSAYKYLGYRLGKNYKRLPQKWVYAMTMDRAYWDRESRRRDVDGIDAAQGYGKAKEEE